jgi:hypothetical protein
LCRRLKINPGWFVEFGAWDGKHLSNTYNLLAHAGWSGVYIEGNAQRYQDLLSTQKQFVGRQHTICAMVGWEGENRLDRLLAQTPTPRVFDLLSIDIDSYDWQVWDALVEYQPKIVVIESNNLLPPGVKQLHQPPRHHGASFSSLLELGKSKGYTLTCHTGNCFFVRNELVAGTGLDPVMVEQPGQLFDYGKYRREKVLSWGRKIFPPGVMNHIYSTSLKIKRLRSKR